MQKTSLYAIPGAIVIAGLLIAGVVYFGGNSVPAPASNKGSATVGQQTNSPENIQPISSSDHILGGPNAPIKIIEFSDLECSFCKTFHQTMIEIMAEYGADNQVAWVFRHFPLIRVHPKALNAAVASECAAQLGGNDAFWQYITRYFSVTPSNNDIDLAELPKIAQDIGLNREEFEVCQTENNYTELIQSQYQEAIDSGAEGTPYSVVIATDGEKFIIDGAQPYEEVKAIIEKALGN